MCAEKHATTQNKPENRAMGFEFHTSLFIILNYNQNIYECIAIVLLVAYYGSMKIWKYGILPTYTFPLLSIGFICNRPILKDVRVWPSLCHYMLVWLWTIWLMLQIFTVNLLRETGFWDEPNADPALKEDIKQTLKYMMKTNKLEYTFVVL